MSRKSRSYSRRKTRIKSLRPLAGLLATGLSVPMFAQSVQFPTYTTGAQPDGSFVVSSGQIITPAGTQVDLGIRVRAKAVALNPNAATHTAAGGLHSPATRCSRPIRSRHRQLRRPGRQAVHTVEPRPGR